MPTFPEATVELVDSPKALASGTELLTVFGCCASNADSVPRLYGSVDALIANHAYMPAASYMASHFEETGKPALFVPLPIVTEGVVGRKNTSGNTGTSVVDVVALAGGSLEECDVVVTCANSADVTVGTDQVMLGLSLDGGRTVKNVRLGTATSYTIPHVKLQITATVGTLKAGETLISAHSTAPRWDQAGLQAGRTALVAQQKQSRGWLIVGDLLEEDDAVDVQTEAEAYDTANGRFIVARCSLRDRLPFAELSHVSARMAAGTSLTFAEVGATGDTITRATGSWLADGFAVGDTIVITGSVSNNITAVIASLSATVITLGAEDLAAEVVSVASIVGYPTLTFAEVGATGDTITRNRGSWLADGFRVGDKIVVTGSASNNITATAGLTAVTATVLTLDTDDLAAEVVSSAGVTIVAGETKAQHVTSTEAEYADVDDAPRLNLGHGRGRKLCRVLGYRFRRSVQWAASLREYQHDVHIPCWRKSDGPLLGWDLEDEDGNLVEHDDRIDGRAATAAKFTSFRTYANGPGGAFITRSMTRAVEGSQLLHDHNMHVANIACTVVQRGTEGFIGTTPTVDANGFATKDELNRYKSGIDSDLENALLRNVVGEGQRCSNAKYFPATNDDLTAPDATLNGEVELSFRGTVIRVATKVRVASAA